MKKYLVISAVLPFLAGMAFASDATSPSKPSDAGGAKVVAATPAALQLVLQSGLRVEKQFPAAGGLTGWVLAQGPGKYLVVYTTADGEYALAGSLLSASGENLTQKYTEQHVPKPDYDKHWAKLEASAYVIEGAKGKDVKSVIYSFMDPNCGYCHMAWKAFQPYEKAGLQIRWIPVAFLAQDSLPKAAALLSAPDKDAALASLNANFGKPSTVAAPSAELKQKVEANSRLMAELGFQGTPATLYKDAAGKVAVVEGMPRLSQLPTITGLPPQQINDPDLARFR